MSNIQIFKYLILSVILGIASYTDIKKRIIPNMLILCMLLFALFFIFANLSINNTLNAVLGFIVAGAVFTATYFFSKGNLGVGDVKLAMCLAIYVGLFDFINIIIYALIYTVVVGLIYIILKKDRKTQLPFAPFIFAGCLTNMLLLLNN